MFFAPKYIVSEKYRFVYCFIPKVACTSIKTAIAPLFGIDTTGMEIPRKNQIRRYIIHEVFYRSEHQITKKQLIEGLDGPYSEFFKFGFVRNPWARLVSCYSDKIIGEGFVEGGFVGMGEKGTSTFYRNMPFDEFVEAVYATPDVKADIHFRSQHWNMCHHRGEYIADYIGRFENLAEDFSHVEEQIGVKLELPHMLHSRRDERHYTRYYTNKLRDLVGERYRTDVELFGYSFDSPSPTPTPEQQQTQRLEQRSRKLEEQLRNEEEKTQRLKQRSRKLEQQLRNILASRVWKLVKMIGVIKAKGSRLLRRA